MALAGDKTRDAGRKASAAAVAGAAPHHRRAMTARRFDLIESQLLELAYPVWSVVTRLWHADAPEYWRVHRGLW